MQRVPNLEELCSGSALLSSAEKQLWTQSPLLNKTVTHQQLFFTTEHLRQHTLRVNPISLSYPFPLPLPLSFARSRESKGYPNSRFDRGVGLRGSGRYPLKPSIFASLLETKGYPEHTAQPATMSARSSIESHKCIFGLNNWFKNYDSFVLCSTQSCTYIFATMFLIETF